MSSGFSTDVIAAIVQAAQKHGLDPMVLAGLVWKESSGNPFATRYEKGYAYLWDVRLVKPMRFTDQSSIPSFTPCTGATELFHQQNSWGLTQVMGATAREMGFREPFLAALCDPTIGAEYGARYLQTLLKRHKDIQSALSAYNAGAPTDKNFKEYVNPILKQAEIFRREGL